MSEDGRWITINGAHVFLKEGQSPMDAFVKSKGKNTDIKQNFKNEITEKLKTAKTYIDKIVISKENKAGQWGLYVKGKEKFNKNTKTFNKYETYIAYEKDNPYLDFEINNVIEEIKSYYSDETIDDIFKKQRS